MSDRLIDAKQVSAKISMSVTTIYALMSQDRFPKPKRIGKQARRWKESDIDAWIEELPEADTDEWHSPKKARKEVA